MAEDVNLKVVLDGIQYEDMEAAETVTSLLERSGVNFKSVTVMSKKKKAAKKDG